MAEITTTETVDTTEITLDAAVVTYADSANQLATITAPSSQSVLRRASSGVRRTWQRGMATAEYAVGILAAVALALVLLKIFTNQDFFSTLLKFVVGLIGKISGMLP